VGPGAARAAAKQLSRVTHPDKCTHPQATEAQKILSVALCAFKDDPSLREHERAREESRLGPSRPLEATPHVRRGLLINSLKL
jgi:hypothetical protein